MRTGGMRARERYHHDRYRTCGHTGRAEYYMPEPAAVRRSLTVLHVKEMPGSAGSGTIICTHARFTPLKRYRIAGNCTALFVRVRSSGVVTQVQLTTAARGVLHSPCDPHALPGRNVAAHGGGKPSTPAVDQDAGDTKHPEAQPRNDAAAPARARCECGSQCECGRARRQGSKRASERGG